MLHYRNIKTNCLYVCAINSCVSNYWNINRINHGWSLVVWVKNYIVGICNSHLQKQYLFQMWALRLMRSVLGWNLYASSITGLDNKWCGRQLKSRKLQMVKTCKMSCYHLTHLWALIASFAVLLFFFLEFMSFLVESSKAKKLLDLLNSRRLMKIAAHLQTS